MSKNIELKLATSSDLPALEKVGSQLFDNEIKPDRAKEFLEDPRHHLALAYFENDIVGMASGIHYVHPDKDPALFIIEVGVLEDYQNKGIGRSLVQYLSKHGKEFGCSEIWTATEKDNLAARKAYEAAGGIENSTPFISIDFHGT